MPDRKNTRRETAAAPSRSDGAIVLHMREFTGLAETGLARNI